FSKTFLILGMTEVRVSPGFSSAEVCSGCSIRTFHRANKSAQCINLSLVIFEAMIVRYILLMVIYGMIQILRQHERRTMQRPSSRFQALGLVPECVASCRL